MVMIAHNTVVYTVIAPGCFHQGAISSTSWMGWVRRVTVLCEVNEPQKIDSMCKIISRFYNSQPRCCKGCSVAQLQLGPTRRHIECGIVVQCYCWRMVPTPEVHGSIFWQSNRRNGTFANQKKGQRGLTQGQIFGIACFVWPWKGIFWLRMRTVWHLACGGIELKKLVCLGKKDRCKKFFLGETWKIRW